jgi:hypothetical protein
MYPCDALRVSLDERSDFLKGKLAEACVGFGEPGLITANHEETYPYRHKQPDA